MSFTIDKKWVTRERDNIRSLFGDSSDTALLLSVLEVFEKCLDTNDFSDSDKAVFSKGITRSQEAVWGRVVGYILNLSVLIPGVLDIFKEVAISKKAEDRFIICASIIDKKFPDNLAEGLLLSFINDRSQKVRAKAADVCFRRGFKSLLLDLEAMLEKQENNKIKQSLEFSILLLRDGQFVKNGYLTFVKPDGTISSKPLSRSG